MLNRVAQKQRLVAILLCLASAASADPPRALFEERAAAGGRGFRDWRLVCGGEACRILTVLDSAEGRPLLRLEAAGDGRLSVVTSLPLFLPDGVTLTLGTAPGWSVPWLTCGAGGECRADFDLAPDLQAALRRERTAVAGLTLAEGLQVRLPVSLLGFSAAERALSAR